MIPADALLGHIGNLGKTGSGKTYTTKAEIVEPLLDAGRQVAIVDPTSAWWGLRLMPDGKKPSPYPIVILGGPHGDLPLVASSGAACARLVTDQLASVVFDTGAMTVADRTRWFTDFAGELYRSVRQPLTVVIDEVHCFAPQARKLGPQQAMMLHAASELFSGGRSRGLRMIGLSQRPAKWHKDSLTSVDALMLHKLMAPQDRAAAKEWIDGQGDPEKSKQVLGSLASLKKGEYWFWFPDDDILERRQSPRIKTFDSSATPVHGAPRVDVQKIDLGQVKAALAEAAKEAEANDPKHLRARIEQLEDDLAAALAAGGEPDPDANGTSAMQAEIERLDAELRSARTVIANLISECRQQVERFDAIHSLAEHGRAGAIVSPAELTRLQGECDGDVQRQGSGPRFKERDLHHEGGGGDRVVRGGEGQGGGVRPRRLLGGAGAVPGRQHGEDRDRHTPAAQVPKPKAKAAAEHTGDDLELKPGSQRVLDAVAQLHAMGVSPAPSAAVGLLAGLDPTGGHFSNTAGPLGSAGLIIRSAGVIEITEAGLAAANPPEKALSLADYHAMLRRVLGKKGGSTLRILDSLIAAGPGQWTSQDLGKEVGIDASGGHFSNSIGPLGTLGLIERRAGVVETTSLLFPEALVRRRR